MTVRFMSVKMLLASAAALLILSSLFVPACASDGSADSKNILLLNSYYRGYSWEDQSTDAIIDYFRPRQDVTLYVEYMDLEQFVKDPEMMQHYNMYKEFFKDVDFDVIIASNSDAIAFIVKYHDDLFPGVPVVSAGTPFLPDKYAAKPYVTGITNGDCIFQTMDLIRSIHPGYSGKIYFVYDRLIENSPIDISVREYAEKHGYANEIVYITADDIPGLISELQRVPDDAPVLYMRFLYDADGNVIPAEDTFRAITLASKGIIYLTSLNQFEYCPESAGGYLISPYVHGEKAAEIADKVLMGISPGAIPITSDDNAHPMLNYPVIVEKNYDIASLPYNTEYINIPDKTINISLEAVAGYLAIILGSVIGCVIFYIMYQNEKHLRMEIFESFERLRVSFNSKKYGIIVCDYSKNRVTVSDSVYTLLNLRKDAVEGISPKEMLEVSLRRVHPDFYEKILLRLKSLETNDSAELKFYSDNGTGGWRWMYCTMYVIKRGRKGNIVRSAYVFRDIDKLERTWKELGILERREMLISSLINEDVKNHVEKIISVLNGYMNTVDEGTRSGYYAEKMAAAAAEIKNHIDISGEYLRTGDFMTSLVDIQDIAAKASKETGIAVKSSVGGIGICNDGFIVNLLNTLFTDILLICKSRPEITVTNKSVIGMPEITFHERKDGYGLITIMCRADGFSERERNALFMESGVNLNENTRDVYFCRDMVLQTGSDIQETGIEGHLIRFEITVTPQMWEYIDKSRRSGVQYSRHASFEVQK